MNYIVYLLNKLDLRIKINKKTFLVFEIEIQDQNKERKIKEKF